MTKAPFEGSRPVTRIDPLISLLEECVVRIDRDGTFSGTGFFVSQSVVLTSAHVVHGGGALAATLADGTVCEAEVFTPLLEPDDPAAKFYPYPDAALLHLPPVPPGHPCVRLEAVPPAIGDRAHLTGFTDSEHAAKAIVRSGVALTVESLVVEDGNTLIKFRDGQVVNGFSGGPLLNLRTGAVFAMIESTRSKAAAIGGFGVPIAAIAATLDADLLRRNAAATIDGQWSNALAKQASNNRQQSNAGSNEWASDGYLKRARSEVWHTWIEEFLSKSLQRIVPIALDLYERQDLISAPLYFRADNGTRTPTRGSISEIFDPDASVGLLLLGEPGAGKTSQLLRLAEDMLGSGSGKVPIVLTLSSGSWKVDPYKYRGLRIDSARLAAEYKEKADEIRRDAHPSVQAEQLRNAAKEYEDLVRQEQMRLIKIKGEQVERAIANAVGWLADEMASIYQVPTENAIRWLRSTNCPIALLLDGLDEIRDPAARLRCLDSLSLIKNRLAISIAVCCRTNEYLELKRRLRFELAVEIARLRPDTVEEYLATAGPRLKSLRQACVHSRQLSILLSTPLALTVAVLAYRDREVTRGDLKLLLSGRMDHLWNEYLRVAISRPRSGLPKKDLFTERETLFFVHRLAQFMEDNGRDVFLSEGVSVDWVLKYAATPADGYSSYVGASAALAVTVVCAAVAWTSHTVGIGLAVLAGSITAGTAAAIFARNVKSDGMKSVNYVSQRWRPDWAAAARSFGAALPVGGAFGLPIGIFGGAQGLLLGVFPALCAGLSAALIRLPAGNARRKVRKWHFASRMTLFVRTIFGIFGLLASIIVIAKLSDVTFTPEVRDLGKALAIGATGGAWVSRFCYSTYGWWSQKSGIRRAIKLQLVPIRIDDFLGHAEEKVIMRRSPTGFLFLHRTLQEHLASESRAASVR